MKFPPGNSAVIKKSGLEAGFFLKSPLGSISCIY